MTKANADQYTTQLCKDTISYVTNQYFDLDQPFAVPRYGNECTAYITGRDYMKAVADAIRGAKKFVFITGWELDYDVELDRRGEPGHPGRLSELIADAVQRGVHVRVILYDSIRKALDTHDDTTQAMLEPLSRGNGSISVMLQNPNTGRPIGIGQIGDYVADKPIDVNAFFSHHQKSVIVDGQVAFVGGLDLAYGRWDTNAFDIVIDSKLHVINDAYNEQIERGRPLTEAEKQLLRGANSRPGFHPSYKDGGKVLNETCQPRQPWQDVAVRIKGPATFDVFTNFVLRWNSFAESGTNRFDAAMDYHWFEKNDGPKLLVDPLAKGTGSNSVQICRSASSKQLNDELELWDGKHKYLTDDWKMPNVARRKIIRDARAVWKRNDQTSIRDAMISCIRSAHGFIYIENQFFMSDCGVDQNGAHCPSNNPIIVELADAIARAIYADRPFHVYLVLPEHPEGKLEEDGTASQAWWALQGVKRANNSLVNRINATLLARHIKAWGLEGMPSTNVDVQERLAAHGMAEKWKDYLTVLNLRNYGHTATTVLTEMIYVHSKLLIVDDAVAIIGSANINDRSLNGNGDTEIAAVIVDDVEAKMTDVGQGIRLTTRKFARDLRIKLWRKHLGMEVDQPTTGVQKETAPPLGVKLEHPLDTGTIEGIKKLAAANRTAYNRVFTHTPRNEFGVLLEGRWKYPALTRKVKESSVNGVLVGEISPDGSLRDPYVLVDEPTGKQDFSKVPPLRPEFMDRLMHNVHAAVKELRGAVKGFWVEMPLDWGGHQNITPRLPGNSPQAIANATSSNVEAKA
jgi:phospholipase D1/2